MTKRKIFIGKLIGYERKNCSYYGNPKYLGVFQNEDGTTLMATTATDASCAYCFLNQQDHIREVEYHTTRNGNNIIDYIRIK